MTQNLNRDQNSIHRTALTETEQRLSQTNRTRLDQSEERGETRHSQLQDEDDLGLVLVHVVQCDDVGVLQFLQDVHLALNVLPRHPAPARPAAALLDELGGVLHARASVPASSDHGKLTTGDEETYTKMSSRLHHLKVMIFIKMMNHSCIFLSELVHNLSACAS